MIDTQAGEHPVMKGLPKRWKHYKDEIYTKLRGPAKNIEILATTSDAGRDEPVMWTVRYGKGRVFVDVLGHCGNDPDMTYSMTCTGFQVTFARGCEWAATGIVTLMRKASDCFEVNSYILGEMIFLQRTHTL